MFNQSNLRPQCEMKMQTLLLLSYMGPLMGEGAQCRLSSLRNGNVPCQYFVNVPVDFKVVQCCLSNLRKCHVALSTLRVKGPLHGPTASLLMYLHIKVKCIEGKLFAKTSFFRSTLKDTPNFQTAATQRLFTIEQHIL